MGAGLISMIGGEASTIILLFRGVGVISMREDLNTMNGYIVLERSRVDIYYVLLLFPIS